MVAYLYSVLHLDFLTWHSTCEMILYKTTLILK